MALLAILSFRRSHAVPRRMVARHLMQGFICFVEFAESHTFVNHVLRIRLGFRVGG